MPYAISIGFLILCALHAPPAFLAVRPGRMAALYGVAAMPGGLGVLMHHRAMLFALVALGCLAAALVPAVRGAVLVLTGWSMTGFLLAYWIGGCPGGAVQRIAQADLIGMPVLIFLVWAVSRAA